MKLHEMRQQQAKVKRSGIQNSFKAVSFEWGPNNMQVSFVVFKMHSHSILS